MPLSSVFRREVLTILKKKKDLRSDSSHEFSETSTSGENEAPSEISTEGGSKQSSLLEVKGENNTNTSEATNVPLRIANSVGSAAVPIRKVSSTEDITKKKDKLPEDVPEELVLEAKVTQENIPTESNSRHDARPE